MEKEIVYYDWYKDEKKGGYTVYFFKDFENDSWETNFEDYHSAKYFIVKTMIEYDENEKVMTYKKELDYTLKKVFYIKRGKRLWVMY